MEVGGLWRTIKWSVWLRYCLTINYNYRKETDRPIERTNEEVVYCEQFTLLKTVKSEYKLLLFHFNVRKISFPLAGLKEL